MSQKIVRAFECKAASPTGQFEGIGSTFGNVDHDDDVVVEGAFTKSLDRWASQKQLPMMPWMHDISNPIGEYTSLQESKKGLEAKGILWVPGNELGRDPIEVSKQVRNLMLSNGPKGMSIGFQVKKHTRGTVKDKPVRFLEEIDLMELSVVPFGANSKARITGVKNCKIDIRELEEVLRDAGLSRKQAKALLAEGYHGIAGEDSDPRDAEPGEELVDMDFLKSLASLTQSLS